MNDLVSSIVEEYIALCSCLCKTEQEYTKKKIKKHNNSMKKMISLTKTMHSDIQLSKKVYLFLLGCDDEFVRQCAASDCLSLNILEHQAEKILTEIYLYGDRMRSMEAERTLLVWKGLLDPQKPF